MVLLPALCQLSVVVDFIFIVFIIDDDVTANSIVTCCCYHRNYHHDLRYYGYLVLNIGVMIANIDTDGG